MDKVFQKALLSKLDEIIANDKEILRGQERAQKSLDLIYADRELIRDTYEAVNRQRDLLLTEHEHQEIVAKQTQEEIGEVKNKVEEKAEDVKDHMDSTKVDIVKGIGAEVNKPESIAEKILGKKG